MDLTELLNQGIAAARAGRRDQARQILAQVVRADTRQEAAWLWLSTVVDDTHQAMDCLERVLALNPANQHASERLETLRVVQLLQGSGQVDGKHEVQGDFRLGEWLVRQGVLTQAALEAALVAQQKVRRVADREPLGTILLRQGAVTAEDLTRAFEHQIARSLEGKIGDGVFRQVGYYLVKYGYLSPAQLANAITRQTLLAQRGKRVKLGELLINDRIIRREQLDQALKAQRQDYDRQFGGRRR